jgi:hypothetical protein
VWEHTTKKRKCYRCLVTLRKQGIRFHSGGFGGSSGSGSGSGSGGRGRGTGAGVTVLIQSILSSFSAYIRAVGGSRIAAATSMPPTLQRRIINQYCDEYGKPQEVLSYEGEFTPKFSPDKKNARR